LFFQSKTFHTKNLQNKFFTIFLCMCPIFSKLPRLVITILGYEISKKIKNLHPEKFKIVFKIVFKIDEHWGAQKWSRSCRPISRTEILYIWRKRISLQSPKTEFGLYNHYGHVIYPSLRNFLWKTQNCTVGGQKSENKPSEPKNEIRAKKSINISHDHTDFKA
jgi:hypothetical protein